jgi:hypothetical protein
LPGKDEIASQRLIFDISLAVLAQPLLSFGVPRIDYPDVLAASIYTLRQICAHFLIEAAAAELSCPSLAA